MQPQFPQDYLPHYSTDPNQVPHFQQSAAPAQIPEAPQPPATSETQPEFKNPPADTPQPVNDPVSDADEDEYTYIKTDTGYERVKTSWLEERIRNQRGPGNAQNAPVAPEEEREHWVHLANGDVVTLKDSELPGHAGSNAHHGFLTPEGQDAPVQIIGVYPK